MKVFELDIPSDRALTNFDLSSYIEKLRVPHFRGVYMRNTLPKTPKCVECGIMNLNTSDEIGSHWVGMSKITMLGSILIVLVKLR